MALQGVDKKDVASEMTLSLKELIEDSKNYNGWFDANMVRHMLVAIGESLQEESLKKWLEPYSVELEKNKGEKIVGVVMAGNIPAVGFHDFLTVLISGNKLMGKLSGDDNKILPALAGLLVKIEPGFSDYIHFTEDRLSEFDAIIATGSSNTSRYFDYYFGKYPNIIRKNRNGIAVLTDEEDTSHFEGLADDIFLYYGLGCRNVSKLYVPENYDFQPLLNVLSARNKIAENHKYFNNYEYSKAIYLVNGKLHFDTGNLLLLENDQVASPVSVINYEYYNHIGLLRKKIDLHASDIQCVVSESDKLGTVVPFGKSQQPGLWDYADGVDTMRFLLSIDDE